MEERGNDDQMHTVEYVDSSVQVNNKPYELGAEEENFEPAGTKSQDKCEAALELVESTAVLCTGSGDTVPLGDETVAAKGGAASGLQDREAAEGGGEIIADDPPVEIKIEEETKSVGDELKVDAAELVVASKLEADQELSPIVDANLEMVGTDVGNAPSSSESQMDAGGDETVNLQHTVKAEEGFAPVIDGRVDLVVAELSTVVDDKLEMVGTDLGNVPAQMDPSGDELASPRIRMKAEEELVIDSKLDVIVTELFPVVDAKLEPISSESQMATRRDETVNPQPTMKTEEESATPVVDGKVDVIGTDMNDEQKTYDFPMDAKGSELQAEMEGMESLEYDKSEGGVSDVETVIDVRRVDKELAAGLGVENNAETLVAGDEVSEEKAGVLANDSEVGMAEIAAEVEEKLEPVITGDIPIPDDETNAEFPIPDNEMNAEVVNEVNVCVANVSDQEPVDEFNGSRECSGSSDTRHKLAEDKKVDHGESLGSGNDIVQDECMSMELLKTSSLDEQVDVQKNLENVALEGKTSIEDIKKEIEVGVESTTDALMEQIQPTDAREGTEMGIEVVADKTRDDVIKETEVGVEYESTRDAVTEEIQATDTQMGVEVVADKSSDDIKKEIQTSDAQVGTELEIEAVADKTKDGEGAMEMEETPSDVDEAGQYNDDSPAAPQDEDDEKLVAGEETGTQDMVMETETDIPDSEKTSGGKRKRGKVSKSPISKATTKASSKKKVGEDVCFICFDGGELVICDRRGCPKAYHPSCVNRDEAFFKSKGRWNCGWHLCSICEKKAWYMCLTCTFSLCKSCIKDTVILCVRGNKGFCEACMRTVMLIENNKEELKDTEVDFDDKNSWEYLFKDYYSELKDKLSLSSSEIMEAKNPWKGAHTPGPSNLDANGGSCSDDSTENVEPTKPKRKKVKKQGKSHTNEDELIGTSVEAGDKATISLTNNSEWASKELLEFVSHMKDDDISVLSQFDVQALLLEYITRNKLRDPRRKSQIICDARLENLFGKQRVGHFEMLKLLESHFLVRDEQNDDVQGSVVDAENNLVDTDANADPLIRDVKDRKRKSRKKGSSRGPQSNLDDYAAIDMHNIGLIYLRRKLMEDLLEDAESFQDKVIGTFVRIRISGSTQKQDLYRLVQVVGTSKATEPYKIGKKTTDIMVEILNLDKTEIISIDTISNQEFSEEECKRLRQSIKCGLINRMTVGEILDKTMELQAARVNDWLESETMRLSHLRDRASDLGRRKELRECVEKLQLLKTPEERQRRLDEIPEIHADPKMDPSYESDDNDSETEDSRQDAFMRSRSSSFNRRGRVPISPGSENSTKDSWSGASKLSSKTWEPIRDQSSNNFSISGGHSSEIGIGYSSTLGRDRGRQESSNLAKINSAASSEPAELALHTAARPESSSGMTSLPSQSFSSARPGEVFVKINESEKIWHYQDPSGKVQGPFSMVQLRKWNNTGYFPANLRIWRTTETQANSILLADALAGKIPKELPPVDNILLATNPPHSSHTLTGHASQVSRTFSHQDKERPNMDQMPGSIPKHPAEKLLAKDTAGLPSPTPKQNKSASPIVEGVGDIPAGAIQSPNANGVLSSPTPAFPNIGTHSSAPASVLSSVLQAVAFSSIPNSQPGSLVDSALSLHAQSTVTREPPVVQMYNNPQAGVQSVQSITGQNIQTNTQGWAAGAPSAQLQGQPQGYGWGSSNVQNSSGSLSNSGTPSAPQSDVWRPTQSSQPNIHPPPATPDASWAMGPAGNNAPMGVRPDNPNIGWGSMPANPNMGWGNSTAGNPNMSWGPAMQMPPPVNTPGWVAPPGNAGPNVQGMVPANPNPSWVPPQGWGPPPVQGQAPGNGWGMPGGNPEGPPPPAQGPSPGNGWGLPSGNAGGAPPLVQGPPQGNTNQGWVAPPGNQGAWNGDQNHMGGQFSSQMRAQGRDPGFNGSRPWNRQSSFGGSGGGSRPVRRRDTLCPYNANGRCRKGVHCDYMHA